MRRHPSASADPGPLWIGWPQLLCPPSPPLRCFLEESSRTYYPRDSGLRIEQPLVTGRPLTGHVISQMGAHIPIGLSDCGPGLLEHSSFWRWSLHTVLTPQALYSFRDAAYFCQLPSLEPGLQPSWLWGGHLLSGADLTGLFWASLGLPRISSSSQCQAPVCLLIGDG